jgi:hypothetical protein
MIECRVLPHDCDTVPEDNGSGEFKCIEEGCGYASIEFPVVSMREDDLSYAIFKVQRRLLNDRPLYLMLNRDEFAAVLLKCLGPTNLSSAIVDDLFDEVDIDGDGYLSVEEIANHLYNLNTMKQRSKTQFVTSRLAKASLGGVFLFFCASSLSIWKNLFIRMYGQRLFTTALSYLVVWLSLAGSVMFVCGTLFSTMEQMKSENVASFTLAAWRSLKSIGQVSIV